MDVSAEWSVAIEGEGPLPPASPPRSPGTLLSKPPASPCSPLTKQDAAFAFEKNSMPEATCSKLLTSVPLGIDPSSDHFARRQKAIRFVMVINGAVKCFSQDYFHQDEEYNDFSGGYRRAFNLIPDEVFVGPLADYIRSFATRFEFPEKTVFLVQIQETTLMPSSSGRRESVTGQGIHTDGHNYAAIACLRRGKGVRGALNQFHGKLDGSEPLCDPTALDMGDAVFFKDNAVYHYVTPGHCELGSEAEDCKRAVLLVHGPAEDVMFGISNEENTLGTKASSVQLRKQ